MVGKKGDHVLAGMIDFVYKRDIELFVAGRHQEEFGRTMGFPEMPLTTAMQSNKFNRNFLAALQQKC